MDEVENINFGRLNGWLKAIGRVNDKTNNGHHFEIFKYDKPESIEEMTKVLFSKWANNIDIKYVKEPTIYLEEKIMFWFYNYQPNKFSRPYFLEDKKGAFSLYDDEDRKEWAKEFIDLLIETTKIEQLFSIKLKDFKTYYCNMADDILISGKTNLFHLHFSLTD